MGSSGLWVRVIAEFLVSDARCEVTGGIRQLYTASMTNDKRDDVVYPVRITREEFDRLKVLARAEDLNGAQFIRRSIRQAIERRQRQATRDRRPGG